MSLIQIKNLTFEYEGSIEKVFDNISIQLDTNWKLGLIGRNGKGKTTLLKLLLGKYPYLGSIQKSVEIDYFPIEIPKEKQSNNTIDIIEDMFPYLENWKLQKELNLLHVNLDILYRPFNTLSEGEKVKVCIAILFSKDNNFLLLDEPGNHLDVNGKEILAKYLKTKQGFILVSHDREFLDEVVDHIISINNFNIQITKGNYSIWKENIDRQNQLELKQNEKLQHDIERLEIASKNTKNWSDKIEKTKTGDGHVDKGYIGHQAAKMMQRSKSIEKRQEKSIEKTQSLLKNIDQIRELTMKPISFEKKNLFILDDLIIKYNEIEINKPFKLEINNGDRIAIKGKNGSGKSSILKLLTGENILYNGTIKKSNNIKISYVQQKTDELKGTLHDFAKENKVDEHILKSMLFQLGVSSLEFEKNIQELSEGQKKKVLLAKSICECANLYIWDEPLNYIDIQSRIQIENMILKYNPTIIFVEHDNTFIKNISTKLLEL